MTCELSRGCIPLRFHSFQVVSNPEIKSLQNVLLDALVDPSRKTAKALDSLLATSFVHYIDSSSLALVSALTLGAMGRTQGILIHFSAPGCPHSRERFTRKER